MTVQKPEIRFGKFEIIECLKKDTHGSVFLANHIFLSKKIILKTLLTTDLPDPARLKRFQREAKILARLDHPAIIKVLDFGTVKDEFYISFEYFPSDNLRRFLQQQEISDSIKYQLAQQLLQGIGFAHKNGIIHRDIKPENILVDQKYQLKIADFGLAEVMQEERLTYGSAIVGTPGYMSPEQISGSRLTQQSDLFSIGIVLLEMFIGRNPFLGKDLAATLNNIAISSESIASKETGALPVDLQPIIRKLLHRQPQNRFSDVEDVLQAWPEASQENTIVTTSRSFLPIWQYLVIIGIGLLAILYLNQNGESSEAALPAFAADSANLSTAIKPLEGNLVAEVETTAVKIPESETLQPVVIKDAQPPESSPGEKLGLATNNAPGELMIRCLPWANISIDEREYDTTPLKKPIELATGEYLVHLKNPGYPLFSKHVKIEAGERTEFAVRLDTLFGYLDLQVYPWARVYIDGENNGSTPLQTPLVLEPGYHSITLENPAYANYQDSIMINRRDTLQLHWNFETAEK